MKYSVLVVLVSIASYAATIPKDLKLNAVQSDVSFVAKLSVGGSINGKVDPEYVKTKSNPLKGDLKVSDKSIQGSAEFALASFDTGIGLRTRHMKEKYLQVDKFPDAKIKFEEIALPAEFAKETASKDGIPFKGKLNMHGKELDVSGTVKVEKNKNDWNLTYQFPVDIKKLGIEIPNYFGVTVKDIVDVNVQLKG